MMFAVAALFACNNDDEGQGQLPEGKAYVSLNISLKDPGTKAAAAYDNNAEDVEAAIRTIDVYLEREGVLTGYERIASLSRSSFTETGGGQYTTTSAVEVSGTAGDNTRRLFVVINQPAGFDPRGITDGVYTSIINELTNDTQGFVMFNAEEAFANLKATQADADADRTQVSMERLAAKALLTTSLDFTNDVPDDQPGGSTGVFKANSLKWQIQNSNTMMYYIKNSDNKSPNWDWVTAPFPDYEQFPGRVMEVPSASDGNLTATGYMNDGTPKVQYFAENTHEKYVYGNTTLMTIQAEFVPARIATAYNSADGFTMADNTTLQTFYYAVAEKTYMDEITYNAFIAEHTGATVWGPYTDGVCYYNVPVGIAPLDIEANLGTKRNHFYKGKITKLIAPGQPKPDPEDPDEPVIKDKVWIGVELTIEPWTMQDMGEIELQ